VVKKYFIRLWNPVLRALRAGTSPRQLALTCALGVVIGIFPVYGSTTLLCFAAALLLRLNVLVMQAVNYLLTPVQLILLIPFMQAGNWFFGLPPLFYPLDQIVVQAKGDFWFFLRFLGKSLLAGAVVWAAVAAVLLPVLFGVFFWMFTAAPGFRQGQRKQGADY